jgi:Tol biopolymer transport system component
LYVRRLSSFDIRALDGTDGAFAPFFSPSGDEVAFFAGTRLMRVSLTDGHTTQIAESVYEPYGGSWTRDGRFVISTSRAFEITVLGANGDSLQAVSCAGYCSMPELLPDG